MEKTAKTLERKADNLKQSKNNSYVYRAALLTVYGWQMSIPVVVGIALGLFLDKTFPLQHFSWTLNMILFGFGAGLYNANTWLKKTATLPPKRKEGKK
ncbi:MAG: AtpZ/AtpI family protein [Alphaproteobacteria bacterium]|nr:AtpZ/AtpI family protein [Alphaproteobacteria bacterium]